MCSTTSFWYKRIDRRSFLLTSFESNSNKSFTIHPLIPERSCTTYRKLSRYDLISHIYIAERNWGDENCESLQFVLKSLIIFHLQTEYNEF
jgi:hypothetical protein